MLIQKFLDYLQFEKNYSSNTISAYKRDLIQYYQFIIENNGNLKIEKADYKVIRSWIISMVNSNISNRSINRKVSSLKSFYKFLIKTETINSSPLKAHSPLKQSKKIQVQLFNFSCEVYCFKFKNKGKSYLDQLTFSDLNVFTQLAKQLPEGIQLQIANYILTKGY